MENLDNLLKKAKKEAQEEGDTFIPLTSEEKELLQDIGSDVDAMAAAAEDMNVDNGEVNALLEKSGIMSAQKTEEELAKGNEGFSLN